MLIVAHRQAHFKYQHLMSNMKPFMYIKNKNNLLGFKYQKTNETV